MNKMNINEKVKATEKSFETESLLTFNNPERFKNWLKVQLNFHQYSALNRMLIYSANHDASYVQSFNKWKKTGYHINKGSKGIPILCPTMFKVILVTDSTGNLISRVPWSTATEQQKADAKAGKFKTETKVSGRYRIGYVYDISSTNASEQDLLERYCKDCPTDASDIYDVLSGYLDMESSANDDTVKVYDIVKSYIRQSLLKKYDGTDIDDYIDVVVESDTYCVLSQLNLNQTMLDYKGINSMSWDESQLKDLKKVNKFICESSVEFIYDIEKAF